MKISVQVHPHETPATLQIEDYYRRIGVIPGWPARRVAELCGELGCTVHELGRIAGMTLDQVSGALRQGVFPPSASLHFANLEQVWRELKTGVIQERVLPLGLITKGEA